MPILHMVRAAIVMAAVAVPSAGFAASVDIEQIVQDQVFELAGTPYSNTVNETVDAAEVQKDPEGLNLQEGDENHQENLSVIDPAVESSVLQRLLNNRFNTGAAEAEPASVFNSSIVDISASGELIDNVGINTAAGAFNLQVNSSVVAPLTSEVLAQSLGHARQDTLLNASLVQDVTNEVISHIEIDAAEVNVGINTVAGTGNEQINTWRITTAF